MDLDLLTYTEVTKKLFKLKPLRNDGLLLKIHHTSGKNKIRFIHGCFHYFNNTLAVSNNQGNIFIIDYSSCKFWGLPKLDSCTVIEFSPHNDKHLLVGLENGDILICDIDLGFIQHSLQGHKLGVKSISFAKQRYCLSSSKLEAFIWDLVTATKIQVLNLEIDCSLKYISFVPFSGRVVACFQDDLIQIWCHEKLESVKQFSPCNWKNYAVKSIAFTRNGEFMVVSGHVPTLAIFHLDTSKLLKIINLADHLLTVKQIKFISQPFDGGCNKILGILSGQGIIYFFDVEQNEIASELRCGMEINKFACSQDGTHIICLLCSGEVEIFDIKQYVMPPEEIHVHRVHKKWKINRKRCLNEVQFIKEEIENMLDIKKLKFILKEHLEYPEAFRMKIWEHLLHLPNNVYKYNSVINHVTIVSFDDLYDKYPLEDKILIQGLKRLLNNLVTWCPFFAYIDYLPIFAFPFVRVFHNKPVSCFEAVCTVIVNWCQHWFEYFPLGPVNVLAIAENMLLEHDPELLYHFTTYQVTSNTYVWCLLETIFSEVLTSSEWLILWDHILTNEVSFLLSSVIAYSIMQKHMIMALKTVEDFEIFFKNQNPIDMKRFIKMSYCILKNTSEKFHPRQYLNKFTCIERGNYPLFLEYPRKMVEFQEEEMNKLDGHMINLLANEHNLVDFSKNFPEEGITIEIKEEDKRRLKEVEKLCSNQIQSRQDSVKQEQKHLQEMQNKVEKRMEKDEATIKDILTNTLSLFNGNSRNSNQKKSRHKEKLHMSMNIDLLSRFINKLDVELKNNDKTSSKTEKNKLEDEQHKLTNVINKNQSTTTTSSNECPIHSSTDCSCEIMCPKIVRFTSSTTGGSNENIP